jgi:YtkA-like
MKVLWACVLAGMPVLSGCTATVEPPPDAGAGDAGAADKAWSELTTTHKKYRLRWRTSQPVVTGDLFSVETVLTDAAGAPVIGGHVRVDARMPQHGHGMATKPEADPGVCAAPDTCTHPEGRYRMDGMKFHMPGDWTVTFDVDGPSGSDRAEVVYRL